MEINCSAIPFSLMESELFGYEKGSFTGADKDGKQGIFEWADKGTLFLDEIGELSLEMQTKLLKVLQDKKVRRVGGSKTISVDVKIITATNKDLYKMVQEGSFREDLYYRLNVIPIKIPPLRERRDDIIVLTEHFLEELNYINDDLKSIDKFALEDLYEYSWPGNVRELKNTIERIYILSGNGIITSSDIPSNIKFEEIDKSFSNVKDYENLDLRQAVEQFEWKLMEDAFKRTGTAKDAAKLLNIDPSTFVRKRQRYKKFNSEKK